MNEDKIEKQSVPVQLSPLGVVNVDSTATPVLAKGKSLTIDQQNFSISEQEEDYKVEYEFKIEGMTCVACSGAIERGMKNEFAERGLYFDEATQTHAVSVILLMHKMKITFWKHLAEEKKVTPKVIEDEVEDLGFGAKHINTIELRRPRAKSDIEKASNSSQIDMQKCELVIGDYNSCQMDTKLNKALQSMKEQLLGIESFTPNVLTASVTIAYDRNRCHPRDMIEKLEELGVVSELKVGSGDDDVRVIAQQEVLKYKQKVVVCAVLYVPIIFLIWVVPYVKGLNQLMLTLNIWNGNTLYMLLCLIFASIIQFYSGKQFYSSAWKSLKHKSANMDVLIVIGTTAAYAYGVLLILFGFPHNLVYYYHEKVRDRYIMSIHGHVHNFETSSVLILIVLIGKYIESYSKMKTICQLSKLASLKVNRANLIKETDVRKVDLTCAFKEVQVELLNLKDFVLVQPGGAIPTDGLVVFGHGCTNEAMLTGESRPQTKDIGSRVFGGSILTQGTIIFEVDKLAEDATFNQIMKMVENAQNTKAPIQGVADKVSAYFVPTIVFLAIIDWIIWFAIVYSNDGITMGKKYENRFQFAFDFGISTLVIACPCALGLATPTAVMVGTGLAASRGILIKGADILEKIQKINTIVFDKTGTLTAGKPEVKNIISCLEHFKIQEAWNDKDKLLQMLYLTEKNSDHPIAVAIQDTILKQLDRQSQNNFRIMNSKNIDGEGIHVQIYEEESEKTYSLLCGNLKLMRNQKVLQNGDEHAELVKNITYMEEQGQTVVLLAIDQVPQLIISLEELHLAKENSLMVVNFLKGLGLRVCMITGDNEHTAEKVADYLGIHQQDTYSQASPERKKQIVEDYQKRGDKVMFVGDGINDSPVLAQADIGCAINSASDITVSAAGIVLIKDELLDVIRAILISKKSFQRIKINFCFAFLYNVILIPVAMGVFFPLGFKLDPMYAAVAMGLSSISVVTSSLLLRLYNPDSQINYRPLKSIADSEQDNISRNHLLECASAFNVQDKLNESNMSIQELNECLIGGSEQEKQGRNTNDGIILKSNINNM